ncbi:MAG: hypothetical protein IPP49_08870 [Saprospiraceae bacterium]|nr:hypothetical protein [Saprospiraceae bacterium]
MRKLLIFVFVVITTSSWAQHFVVLKNGSVLSEKFSIVENQTKISIQNGRAILLLKWLMLFLRISTTNPSISIIMRIMTFGCLVKEYLKVQKSTLPG